MEAAARQRPSWADLQPELLGLVLRRLPSLADRIRFGAVCREWRHIVRQEPLPPPLPWLTLLDGTFLGNQQIGEIHRMHLPDDASLHGSTGNWLLLKRPDSKLELMNPFSRCFERLPMEPSGFQRDYMFHKLVPLSTLDDDLLPEDCTFALLTMDGWFYSAISIGRRHFDAIVPRIRHYIHDIAFFQGKLYALSRDKLFAFEIVSMDDGKLSVPSIKHVANVIDDPKIMNRTTGDKMYNCFYLNSIVASSSKLLHVRRLVGTLSTLPIDEKLQRKNCVTISFEVYELDLTTNSNHNKWRRLDTLPNQAIFIGIRSSKVVPAYECGAQEDCIYFMCDYDYKHRTTDPLRDYGIFNLRNKMITPLSLDTTIVHPQGCKGLPTWFFPNV